MLSDTARLSEHPQLAPLTYGQRNLCFIQQLVPDVPVFNMCKAWRIHGIVDLAVEEIEAHLNLHSDVRTTAVGLWQDTRGENFLVAWCVPEPGRVIAARSSTGTTTPCSRRRGCTRCPNH